MATYDNSKFYWLQLQEEFFDSDLIDWLEEQPNGPAQVLFYLKLCLKSLKTNGVLIRRVGTMLLPYDEAKLAEFTRTDVNTVQCAMVNLKMCGLIEILENGAIYLTQIETLIGSQSASALKRQQQREKQRLSVNASLSDEGQKGDKRATSVATSVDQSIENRDIENRNKKVYEGQKVEPLDDYDLIADQVGSEFDFVDLPAPETRVESKEEKGSRIPPCPYERIVELYHEVLPELPKTVVLTNKRRGWINARWRAVCVSEGVSAQKEGLEFFKGYFELVKESPFLLGLKSPGKGHSRVFKADLEWLMNESNFTKVIEGKYV